ncbi:sulfatase-modifying factor protein [Mastigocoleus testarum BC008]|uniref:Sulfatase-modifying factor protein n=1 Tax=Mastigocoleus testarum BC008 TaxID=371196 RepID=A0A0V7ZD65_9CYAN|nr:sulfatase-modifying factor protein [Mastigocoleus testarum BC008]
MVNKQPSTPKLTLFEFETAKVNGKGEIFDRPKGKANSFKEDLGNRVTLEMVKIPGDTFTMGSPEDEEGRSKDEGPQRQVTVPEFFMGKYQVTQAQYQQIMGANPSNFKGDKRPVEKVSWNNAVEFCKKLSQKTGRTYRLPSEAEWEYACRAGTTTPFYFDKTITTNLVNYNGDDTYASAPRGIYRQKTTEVGTFPPNAFGLYDMHGNVWEWCQDTWHDNYKDALKDGSLLLDNDNRPQRVLRGGSWGSLPKNCRSAARIRYVSDYGYDNLGFRVVCVVSSRT